jgi:hypothetical protein
MKNETITDVDPTFPYSGQTAYLFHKQGGMMWILLEQQE